MKRVSRIFLLLFLLALIPPSLAACGGDSDSGTTTTKSPAYHGTGFEYRLYEGATVGTYDCGYVSGGKAFYEKAAPARVGYILLGLYNDGGELIIDAEGNYLGGLEATDTLTCRWVSEICTLHMEVYGEDGLSLFVDTVDIAYGAPLPTLPSPAFAGYKPLDGWYYAGRVGAPDHLVAGSDGIPTGAYTTLTADAFYEIAFHGDKERTVVYLTARLDYASYTITFDYNDGSGRQTSVAFLHHLDAEDIKGPTVCEGNRDIYAFSTSPTELIPPTTLTGDTTLYAFWRPCRTVTLHNGYGMPDTTAHVTADAPLILAAEPQAHYTFGGWYTAADHSGVTVPTDTAIAMTDAANHYYRRMIPVTYRAVFHSGGGSVCRDITFTVEDEHLALPLPTRTNYVFKGWTNEYGTVLINELHREGGNRDLYAVWEGAPRRFVHRDGEDIHTTEAIYGESYRIAPIAAPEGMLFCGWETEDGTRLTDRNGNSLAICAAEAEETVIRPVFKAAYTLTLLIGDTAIAKLEAPTVFSVAEGEGYTAKVAWLSDKDCGYRFLGWYDGDTLVSTDMKHSGIMPAGDLTLIAHFTPATYEVALDTANADFFNGSSTATVIYKESYTLPVAFKQGHVFLGWEHAESQELVTDATGASLGAWRYISNAVTLRPRFESSAAAAILVYDTATLLFVKDAPNAAYVLVSDIDMTGVAWTPFAFGGTLDGNGFTVKNLTVTVADGNAGMFTTVSGTVKDLILESLSVTSTAYTAVQIGGICGHLSGTLSGVTVASGTVKNDGFGTSGTDLHNRVQGITAAIGGLVGLSDGAIVGCESRAQVISNTYQDGFAVGGIAGFIRGGLIESTVNRGSVESRTPYVGGIAGICRYETALRGVENYGNVSGTTYVGGVFGLLQHEYAQTYQVANLKNHGNISGISAVGGVCGAFTLYWDARTSTTYYATAFTNTGAIKASASSGVAAVGGIFGKVQMTCGYWGEYYINLKLSSLSNTGSVASSGGTAVGGYIGHFLPERDQGTCEIIASTQSGTISGSGTTLDVSTEIGKTGN